VVVREVPAANGIDAVSAYGYPGATTPSGWEPPVAVDWGPSGLVSLFARERLEGTALVAGTRERGRVLIHDPARPREVRPRLAEQIRATERLGYEVEVVPGPEAGDGDRAGFHSAYTETMRRAGASERYFFSPEYLAAALGFERSWLLLARSDGLPVAAGAIAAASDGHLHYFLGGTAGAALDDSPFKNVVVSMLDLADELGMPLNLGGGIEAGDGLERFKRGFANAEAPFRTHEIVCDPGAYETLSAGREAGDFFPAYRAPS
jgi:hypothetical protein